LDQLSYGLCLQQEFFHEIIIFLGYPLEDIENIRVKITLTVAVGKPMVILLPRKIAFSLTSNAQGLTSAHLMLEFLSVT